jgi:hypothetical protein
MMNNRLTATTNYFIKTAGIAALFSMPLCAIAQSPFAGLENLFTVPKNYTVNYTTAPPVIDGNINDPVWRQAKWTEDFQDIEGDLKPGPALQTNAKMLWDDSCLYIAAQVHDPNVWAYLTHRDDIVYRDNDFEVFIDPNKTTHQYYEFEFNAVNTVFDLFLNKPYRNGGNAMINWDAEGIRSATKVQGTVNNPTDTDEGWTIEIAIPFRALSFGIDVTVPKEGDFWRIDFSRVEWKTKVVAGKYVKLKDSAGNNLPENNWVWSPQGVINMHFPERWGYLLFNKGNLNDTAFQLPYEELQRQYLWLIYYREKQWREKNNVYSASLKKFGLGKAVSINNEVNNLKIEAGPHQFIAFITDKTKKITWTINQEGLVRKFNIPQDE